MLSATRNGHYIEVPRSGLPTYECSLQMCLHGAFPNRAADMVYGQGADLEQTPREHAILVAVASVALLSRRMLKRMGGKFRALQLHRRPRLNCESLQSLAWSRTSGHHRGREQIDESGFCGQTWSVLRRLSPSARQASKEAEAFLKSTLMEPLNSMEAYAPAKETILLPCFPVSDTPYLPHSKHTLNIFEPRYRAMYNDMLVSGGRRCVVPHVYSDDAGKGVRLGKVGVVFYLTELNDISESTGDQMKYRCEHELIGRVRIKGITNPQDFATANTYLKAEVEDLEDTDKGEDLQEAEEKLYKCFEVLQELQDRLKGEVKCMQPGKIDEIRSSSKDSREKVWELAGCWSDYIMFRTQGIMRSILEELQFTFRKYFEERGLSAPSRMDDLPQELKDVAKTAQTRQEEAMESVEDMRKLTLQLVMSTAHKERLELLGAAVTREQKMTSAKIALGNVLPRD
mmetsp:Transcript_17680/g.40980  ORF Transcript_17680/g.40980 Transcript_17680/m.40980 type:complete len:457 (+) Transcript_17680:62-1432(+)